MGKLYTYDGADWVEVVGATGASGANGSDGKTILNGAIDPTTEGVDGDFYINTVANTIFGPKAAGVWGTGTSIVGAAGADGADGLTVSVNSVTQVAGDISLTQDNIPDGTTNKAYTATEQTKLAGIETAADVTDATNVAAAGAIMDGDITGNGLMTRTSAGAYTNRTITGTANQVTVTNGDGVSGNPTLSLPQDIHTGATPTFGSTNLTSTGTTFLRINANTTPLTAIEAQLDLASGLTNTRFFYRDSDKNFGFYINSYTRLRINGTSGETTIAGIFKPETDSFYTNGTPTNYWLATHTDRLYLNATAYLDGGTAGAVGLAGALSIPVTTSTAGQITQNGSVILHTYKGASANLANIFLGSGAGNFTSTGSGASSGGNVGIGAATLTSLTTGYNNVAIGSEAGTAITYGYGNYIAGVQAGKNLTTGNFNMFMGYRAGLFMTTGNNNIAIGLSTLRNNNGNNNTAVGLEAGNVNTSGSGNVFIGYSAGYRETDSNTLHIGNVQQSSQANDKAYSLLYGTFSGTAASLTGQTLTINGATTINGNLTLSTKNIVTDTTTGTKIGTATTQKLGFFNATPVVQPASTPANATDLATALTLVNDLKNKLVTLGLIA